MKAAYGDYSYSSSLIVEWCRKFTKDLAHPGPAGVGALDKNVGQFENAS